MIPVSTVQGDGGAQLRRRLQHRVLSAWRAAGSPSHRELVARGVRPAMLPELLRGGRPTWQHTFAVLDACGVGQDEILRWRRALEAAERGTAPPDRCLLPERAGEPSGGVPPSMSDTDAGPVDPLALATAAVTAKQYNQALDALRRSCELSYQEISDNSGGALPKSTAHNLCTRDTLPTRAEQVVQFVLGCGQDREQAALWIARWEGLRTRLRHAEIHRALGPLPPPIGEALPAGRAGSPEPAPPDAVGRVCGWVTKLLARPRGGR